MQQAITLIWGLPSESGVCKSAVVRPLTIGSELNALAAFEDYAEGKQLGDSATSVALTLAYWTQQLSVDGLPAENLTVAYLMENLVSEDYRLIMAAMDDLRVKSTAATESPNPDTVAANLKDTAFAAPTETTGAASS